MELYLKVRLDRAEGLSQPSATKRFNVSRDSVRKMPSFSPGPGHRHRAGPCRPKLDGFAAIIDGWLDGARGVLRKQCHKAKQVFDRVRESMGSPAAGPPSIW